MNANLLPTMIEEFSVDCFVEEQNISKTKAYFLDFAFLLVKPFATFVLIAVLYALYLICSGAKSKGYCSKLKKYFIVIDFFF